MRDLYQDREYPVPEENPVYPEITEAAPEIGSSAPEYSELADTLQKEDEADLHYANIPEHEKDPGLQGLRQRREREKNIRNNFWRSWIKSALQGGAAVMAVSGIVLAIAVGNSDASATDSAQALREALSGADRPAASVQTGIDAASIKGLWTGDFNAPHEFDWEGSTVIAECDCTNDGMYQVSCLECGTTWSIPIPSTGHTAAEPQEENYIAASCLTDGSEDEIIYCSVCGELLSKETKILPATGHIQASPVEENKTEPGCKTPGSADTVVYCSVCGEEISRRTQTIAALGHTPAPAVEENRVEADCTNNGHFDSVVYCSVCREEIKRNTQTIPSRGGHTPSAAVQEKRAEPSCTADGHYDTAVYCSVCNQELSRETSIIPALGHLEKTSYTEKKASCTSEGTRTDTVSCERCGKVLSQETKQTEPALGHDYPLLYSEQYEAECIRCGKSALKLSYNSSTGVFSFSIEPDYVNGNSGDRMTGGIALLMVKDPQNTTTSGYITLNRADLNGTATSGRFINTAQDMDISPGSQCYMVLSWYSNSQEYAAASAVISVRSIPQ